MSLGEKTVKGVVWNYVSFASGKFLTLISTIILARLLAPEQFGQVALALLVIQYLDAIGDLGVSAALIYQRDNLDRAKNVAFIVSILAGIGLGALAYFGAPAFAAFYNEPELVPMLQVLALSVVINAFGQTHMTLLTKELNFKRKLLPDLSRSLVKGLASIILALLGWGAWSMIWGQVLGIIVLTILLWVVVPWRPQFDWDNALARTMLSYGGQIVLIQLLSVVWATADYLIVGKLLGQADLAYYQQAFRITDLLIINIAFVVGKVLFPSYAKMNDDPEQLLRGFFTTIRYIALFTLPLSIGIAAIAPLFVSQVFGPQWLAMIPALQLLALRAGVSTLSFNSGHMLRAIGKPNIINYQLVVKLVVLLVVVWLTVPYGFVAVAAGQVGVAIFGMLLDFVTMRWMIRASLRDIAREIQPGLLAALVMGAVVWPLAKLVPAAWELPAMLGLGLLGALIYAVVLWMTNRALCEEGLRWMQKLRRKKQPALAK
jgi:O-antigen/teichoic acid export membrane protein